MLVTDPIYTANMTDHQRAWFYAEYEHARKDEVVGVLLAIFLGAFGVHHFYLRRNGLGILYLIFFWTGISAILGFIDAFFTPSRVRQFNAQQASYIASQIFTSNVPYTQPSAPQCPSCNSPVNSGAAFCPRCGAATSGQLSTQPAI